MPEPKKSSLVLLRIAGALALLAGAGDTALYCYAKSHFAEILRNGSVKLPGGLITVTESSAQANPHLTAGILCLVLAAVCFFAAHRWRRAAPKE